MLNEFSALAYYNMLRCPHPPKKAKAYYHITSPAYIASGSVASGSILRVGVMEGNIFIDEEKGAELKI